MKIDESKLFRQEETITKWIWHKGKGGIQCPTGFGKTFTALFVAARKMLLKKPNTRVIVVVPFDNLRTQWRNEIDKLIPEFRGRIYVDTVQAFQAKGLQYSCDLLILDEVDEYFAAGRSNIWNGTWIKFNWLLWLSATPADKQKRDTEFVKLYPTVDVITTEEAIEKGWISNYEIYNLGVDLTEEEEQAYSHASDVIDKALSKFNNNFEFAARCLSGHKDDKGNDHSAYECSIMWASHLGWRPDLAQIADGTIPANKATQEYALKVLSQWTPNLVMGYAKELFRYIKIRNKILWQASNKINLFIDIAKAIPKARIIGFGQSTDFADNVTAKLNNEGIVSVAYHSNLESRPLRQDEAGSPTLFGSGPYITYTTKSSQKYGEVKLFGTKVLKTLILKAVLTGVARVIMSASALDKGSNMPGLNLAIITSLTSNPSQFIQRLGRAIRINPLEENKKALIICMYVRNSKEERTLQNVQSSGETIYWINTVQEIGSGRSSDLDFTKLSL
jgi:superfamily II DNA or RNA helicase